MYQVMEILKQKNNLSVNVEGQVVVVPISMYEFRTAPLIQGEEALLISEDAYLGLLLKVYQFDETLKNIVMFDANKFNAFMQSKFARI